MLVRKRPPPVSSICQCWLPAFGPPALPSAHPHAAQPGSGRLSTFHVDKRAISALPYSCGAQLPHDTRRDTKSVLLSSRQTLDLQTQELSALVWGETEQSRGPAPHRLLNRQHSLIYRVSPRAGTWSPLARRTNAYPWLFGTRLGGQALGPCAAVGYQTSRARVPRSSFRLPGLTGPDWGSSLGGSVSPSPSSPLL